MGRDLPALLVEPGPRTRRRHPGLGGPGAGRRPARLVLRPGRARPVPGQFLNAHIALFAARHDEGRDLREAAVVADVLEKAGVPGDKVVAEVESVPSRTSCDRPTRRPYGSGGLRRADLRRRRSGRVRAPDHPPPGDAARLGAVSRACWRCSTSTRSSTSSRQRRSGAEASAPSPAPEPERSGAASRSRARSRRALIRVADHRRDEVGRAGVGQRDGSTRATRSSSPTKAISPAPRAPSFSSMALYDGRFG